MTFGLLLTLVRLVARNRMRLKRSQHRQINGNANAFNIAAGDVNIKQFPHEEMRGLRLKRSCVGKMARAL
jgi:hypothetical protein